MVTGIPASIDEQQRRTAELDALRLERPLTHAEQAEADRLADRAYHRAWRALQREREARLAARRSDRPRLSLTFLSLNKETAGGQAPSL